MTGYLWRDAWVQLRMQGVPTSYLSAGYRCQFIVDTCTESDAECTGHIGIYEGTGSGSSNLVISGETTYEKDMVYDMTFTAIGDELQCELRASASGALLTSCAATDATYATASPSLRRRGHMEKQTIGGSHATSSGARSERSVFGRSGRSADFSCAWKLNRKNAHAVLARHHTKPSAPGNAIWCATEGANAVTVSASASLAETRVGRDFHRKIGFVAQ